jgi:hypothetical protein
MTDDRASDISANNEWDGALDVASRSDAASEPMRGATVVAPTAPIRGHDELPIWASLRRQPPRPHTVWILIGALSISLGMIVSATIVTVTFLA